jgi:hypothetical protein
MPEGTIVFVHGTGVRLKDNRRGFAHAQLVAEAAGISHAARRSGISSATRSPPPRRP